MKAIILAAGKGSRLGALGEGQPKCLLPLGSRLIIDHQRDALTAAGVTDIVVVGGYMVGELRRYLADRCTVVENSRYETTNSIQSLWLARDLVGDEAFVVLNSDVMYDPDLLARFVRHPATSACLVDETMPHRPDEFHFSVADGLVTAYGKDIPPKRSQGECAQLYRVGAADAPAFWERTRSLVEQEGGAGYANGGLASLIERRTLVPVFTHGELWIEIDSLEDYQNALRVFRHRSGRQARRSASGADAVPEMERPFDPTRQSYLPWLWQKLRYHLRTGELPWRVRWMPHFLRGLREDPVRSLALLGEFGSHHLTAPGFNLQVYGPRFLRAVLEECGRLGVRPFLVWGTLLGWVRGDGFIRNDHDIDLGMLADDFTRKDELRRALVARGFPVRIDDPYKLSILHPRVAGLFVDIDLFYEKNGDLVVSNAQADDDLLYSYYFRREICAELRPATFAGVDVHVPAGAEEFLETVYGDWRTPREKSHYLYGPLNLRIEPRT